MERKDEANNELIDLGAVTEVTKGSGLNDFDGIGGQQTGIDNE